MLNKIMLNQVVLVGRLTEEPNGVELNRPMSTITLAIPRSFKNTEGEYETDFVKCSLWGTVAEQTVRYCKKGDIVGVKGRLQVVKKDDKFITEVVAEKVTFLTSHNENEN